MSTLSLYHCAQEVIDAIESCVDHETGEIIDSAALDNAIGQFKDKGAHVAAYALNLEETAEAARAHAKKVANHAALVELKATRLREYLARNMASAGITEITANDGTFTAKLHRDRDESIQIAPELSVDERFARVIPEEKEWDKTALKKAIKAGDPVPSGVTLVKKDRLEIK